MYIYSNNRFLYNFLHFIYLYLLINIFKKKFMKIKIFIFYKTTKKKNKLISFLLHDAIENRVQLNAEKLKLSDSRASQNY